MLCKNATEDAKTRILQMVEDEPKSAFSVLHSFEAEPEAERFSRALSELIENQELQIDSEWRVSRP